MSRFTLSDHADDYRPAGVPKDTWLDFVAGIKCLDNAAADILKAGQLFASISDAQWIKISKAAASPIRRTLEHARDVGRGVLLPQLATASGSYVTRLRSFPVSEQERLLHEPIEVACVKAGQPDKVLVRVPDMEPEQVRQVFRRDGLKWAQRNVDEQRAWLDLQAKQQSRKPSNKEISRPGRWTVREGRVFLASAKVKAGLTRADIEGIIRDMKL
jgi:hypothetical protein